MKKMYSWILFVAIALIAVAVQAGTLPNEYATAPGGGACKSAGVTPSTALDTRAIGARNLSSTSGVFTVCTFFLTPTPMEGGVVNELNMVIYTLDGNTRSVACTAVIGSLVRYVPPTYSTKTFSVGADTLGTWDASDFGGTSGDGIKGSAWVTITCNLPPQTGIGVLYAKLNPAMR